MDLSLFMSINSNKFFFFLFNFVLSNCLSKGIILVIVVFILLILFFLLVVLFSVLNNKALLKEILRLLFFEFDFYCP